MTAVAATYDSGAGQHEDFILLRIQGTWPDAVLARGGERGVRAAALLLARLTEHEDGNFHASGGIRLMEFLTDIYIERPDRTHLAPTISCCLEFEWTEVPW